MPSPRPGTSPGCLLSRLFNSTRPEKNPKCKMGRTWWMSLLAKDTMVSTGNPKHSTQKTFQNKWVLPGCKIQSQYMYLEIFLCIDTTQLEIFKFKVPLSPKKHVTPTYIKVLFYAGINLMRKEFVISAINFVPENSFIHSFNDFLEHLLCARHTLHFINTESPRIQT